MPTAKNGFHFPNLHPKNIYIFKKIPFFNANLLEKIPFLVSAVIKLILDRGLKNSYICSNSLKRIPTESINIIMQPRHPGMHLAINR